MVSPILISGYKLGDLIDSFVNELFIIDKGMYGGKVACIPVYIPTKFGLNWLKISLVRGHTLNSGRLIGPGRLLGQSLYLLKPQVFDIVWSI